MSKHSGGLKVVSLVGQTGRKINNLMS